MLLSQMLTLPKIETADNGRKDNEMKHEMTAREYAYAQAKMCEHYKYECRNCPLNHLKFTIGFTGNCAAYRKEHPYMTVAAVQNWAEANLHPEKKPTMFVPDEMTRIYTLEYTVIDNGGVRRDMKDAGDLLAQHIKRLLNADDVKCVRAQQFVTKCHEEEI